MSSPVVNLLLLPLIISACAYKPGNMHTLEMPVQVSKICCPFECHDPAA